MVPPDEIALRAELWPFEDSLSIGHLTIAGRNGTSAPLADRISPGRRDFSEYEVGL
jgi:hypothetical protein